VMSLRDSMWYSVVQQERHDYDSRASMSKIAERERMMQPSPSARI